VVPSHTTAYLKDSTLHVTSLASATESPLLIDNALLSGGNMSHTVVHESPSITTQTLSVKGLAAFSDVTVGGTVTLGQLYLAQESEEVRLPSLHHYYTIYTIIAQLLHHYCTIITPLLHHYYTIIIPLLHHYYTIITPYKPLFNHYLTII
jgi:hypothetical protein